MQKMIINENPRHSPGLTVPNYHVYMIRIWAEEGQKDDHIRLTAQDTRTGERKGFTHWKDLVNYLQTSVEPKEQPKQ